MVIAPVVAAVLFIAPQASTSMPVKPPASAPVGVGRSTIISPEQLKKAEVAQMARRNRAIHLNDVAGNLHSEAEARKLVDGIAEELADHKHLFWTGLSIRRRVASAEWEAIANSSRLIPEQRIVDVWNEYVREIDAPQETLVSVAELHNLRDAMYTSSARYLWRNGLYQSIWTMPNIYASDSNGHLADGCRALESLKLIHDMHDSFHNLRIARERIRQGGWLASEHMSPMGEAAPQSAPKISTATVSMLMTNSNVIYPAVERYQREHGMAAYDELLRRLFAELFPQN